MVIRLVLTYIFGVAMLMMFLVTKIYLDSQSDLIWSKEKYIRGVNFMSFAWLLTCIFILTFMELLIIGTPTSFWPAAIEFFNEALSQIPLSSMIMFSLLSVVMIFSEYNTKSRDRFLPISVIGKKSCCFSYSSIWSLELLVE